MALDNLTRRLGTKGRQPSIKLEVTPLDQEGRFNKGQPFTISEFTSYSFSSNILIPVDTFTFSFRPNPPKKSDRSTYYDRLVMEGDLVTLTVDDQPLATGIVNDRSSDTDANGGVIITINGRDLMGGLEDNDAVNPDSTILWTSVASIRVVLASLLENTRIKQYALRSLPEKVTSFFATNPGESKLAALQRFLEPLNSLAWMDATGKLLLGRPNFSNGARGVLGIQSFDRVSNVLNFRVVRASGQIPNGVLAIWTALEKVQTITKQQMRLNNAAGPSRLYKAKHFIYRTIATSAPDGTDTKDGLALLQRFVTEGPNFMASLAAREIARENINELLVTFTVPGHFNEHGEPFAPDQCYNIVYDLEGIDEKMYLFSAEYGLSEDGGQVTHLSFCKLGTIVSGATSDVIDPLALDRGLA